jgi:ABC-type multidrug transport system ATPase subunit/pSer/pThr/pTyr-binding forkhead associated (FHA) protein
MSQSLQVLEVSAGSTTRRLEAPELLSIGRNPDQDIVIDHPLISRCHVTVSADAEGWIARDADSHNGVFVDGERVTSARVGATTVRLRLGAVDGPEVLLAPARAGGAVVRIGRAPDNDVVLDDLLVSRHHAELHPVEGSVLEAEIVDLASDNGTSVNGRPVHRARITARDVVGIGHQTFQLGVGGLEPRGSAGRAALVVSGLHVAADSGAVLLDDVTFSIGAASLLAIVGPSGAGKSTLLHALTGSRPADTGDVLYEGRDLYADYDELRGRIGFVPQDDVLHRQLTPRRALSYAAALRFPAGVAARERETRVEEVLAELGLAERADLPIKRLSGGQRKRCSVALELLTKPSLLFLDEPTSGLDPAYERSLMQQLRALADGGRTVVVVTHTVESLHLCDRVLVLAPGGRPAFFGPPQAAPAFFGQQDFQGVFAELTAGAVWPGRFAASDEHRRYVVDEGVRPTESGIARREPPSPPRGGLRQLLTLTRRYVRVLRSDRVNLVLLLGQAPLLGVLLLAVFPKHQLAPPLPSELRIFSLAALLLFNLVQAVTWLGMSNAVREIVKERSVLRRERAVGLSIPAYVMSKVAVLGSICVAQSAVVVGLATIHQGGPSDAVVLGWPLGELAAGLALTGVAAMALGLLVSALVSSENMAMTLLPVLLIVQNVLATGGVFPEILAKPVLNQAQYASSAQWGFGAAASTAELNRLQGLSGVVRDLKSVDLTNPAAAAAKIDLTRQGQRRHAHTPRVWWRNVIALLALTVAALVATGLVLMLFDPDQS